jgi:hypothetical protein
MKIVTRVSDLLAAASAIPPHLSFPHLSLHYFMLNGLGHETFQFLVLHFRHMSSHLILNVKLSRK